MYYFSSVKKITTFLLAIPFLMAFVNLQKMEVLIAKEIKKVFAVENYTKHTVVVSNTINTTLPIKITGNNLFSIEANNITVGYYYVGRAFGKTDYFDFMVIFDKNVLIAKAKVLIYREDHGGEVGSKRWLKQFKGKIKGQKLKYQKDIAAISGATLSAKSMTREINKLLKTMGILFDNKQL